MTEVELRDTIYKKLKLPTRDEYIERLTGEQMEFIIHDIADPSYLEACPGSGKTEVVGLKSSYELIDWPNKFNGIAILSFTNNAASEIQKRVQKFAGDNAAAHPHFIGTVDSFLYNYILYPFFYQHVGFAGKNGDCSPRSIIDERSDADFLKNSKYNAPTHYAVTNPNPSPGASSYIGLSIPANRYYFDLSSNDFRILPPIKEARIASTLREILDRPEQIQYLKPLMDDWLTEKIIYQGFRDTKNKFWKDGFVTFHDCEYLIYKILTSIELIRKRIASRFPYIFIDECQDLSLLQINILFQLIKEGVKVHLIGDINQSIYLFRKVDPKLILQFIEKINFKKLFLTVNFRSNQSIVDLFSALYPKELVGQEPQPHRNSKYVIEFTENQIEKLKKRYEQIIELTNIEVNLELIRKRESVIIIRGNSLLNRFKPFKTSNNPITILAIALQLWNKEGKNADDLKISLSFLGSFLSKVVYENTGNAKSQYCPEGLTSYEWRIALSVLIRDLTSNLYPFKNGKGVDLSFSEWAKLVRAYIPEIIKNLPLQPFTNFEDIILRVQQGLGSELVTNNVKHFNGQNTFRTTTIHNVKGETLDSIMLVSSLDKRSPGGHWEDWFNPTPLDDNESEHKRYGYVALSRPKHLLVLAVPKLNAGQRKFFTDLEFVIENLNTETLF